MEKAKNLIAFLFQRSGKTRLDEKEIYMSLSYELRWFTPEKAKIFLHKSVENGLLKSEGEGYCPTFDYQNVQIPLGFTVDDSVVEEEDTFSSILKELEKRGMERENLFRELEHLKKKMNVIPEVAALILAKKHGIDISPFIKKVKKIVINM
jgi:hypothetical protein